MSGKSKAQGAKENPNKKWGGHNKGKTKPLMACRRHKVVRARTKPTPSNPRGSVLCKLCHNEASKDWNRRNPEAVDEARKRFRVAAREACS